MEGNTPKRELERECITSISSFKNIELSFGRHGTLFLVTSADFLVFAETTIVFEQ